MLTPRSRFAFPGRPPRFNTNHPAAQAYRMCAVARGNNFFDIVRNIYATPATQVSGSTNSEINDMGPSVWSTGTASGAYCAMPSPTGATEAGVGFFTLAGIVKPSSNYGAGEGFVGTSDTATCQLSIKSPVSGSFPNQTLFLVGGTTIWTLGLYSGRVFLIIGSWHKSLSTGVTGLVLDMYSGQIQTFQGSANAGTFTHGVNYNIMTYNVAAGVGTGRVACVSLNNYALNLAQMLQWAQDPWGLWYAPQVDPSLAHAVTSGGPSATQSPAIMVGV